MVFFELHLDTRYFLFFLLVRTQMNQKVFQRVSMPRTAVYVRCMDFPDSVHTLVPIALLMVVAKASRTGNEKKRNARVMETNNNKIIANG
jgi:hypothetical protein